MSAPHRMRHSISESVPSPRALAWPGLLFPIASAALGDMLSVVAAHWRRCISRATPPPRFPMSSMMITTWPSITYREPWVGTSGLALLRRSSWTHWCNPMAQAPECTPANSALTSPAQPTFHYLSWWKLAPISLAQAGLHYSPAPSPTVRSVLAIPNGRIIPAASTVFVLHSRK